MRRRQSSEMRVHIGTSGWHYKHWLGNFYPAKFPASKMLEFYVQRFSTVEVNNSFYSLPKETGLANWYATAPPGFLFAMKGSRYLTHMKKLKDAGPGLDKFFARADLLKEKLGPIVFQTPPFWTKDTNRLATFLEALPIGHQYSFEFRHESWHSPDVYELLRRANAAFCQFHLAGFESPRVITADFAYVRLHGPGGKYQGSYSDADLDGWAEQLRAWDLPNAFVYFDNDEAGYAAGDAFRLEQRL